MAVVLLLVVIYTVIAATALWTVWALEFRGRTRRKGSKYHVPPFHASFEQLQPKWTPHRMWTVQHDKAEWDAYFRFTIEASEWRRRALPGRGSTEE
jgi:hypothetical protein